MSKSPEQTPEQRIAQLEAQLASANAKLEFAEGTSVRLRRAYLHALEQLPLLRQRLFGAKAERANFAEEHPAFDVMRANVTALAQALDAAEGNVDEVVGSDAKTTRR